MSVTSIAPRSEPSVSTVKSVSPLAPAKIVPTLPQKRDSVTITTPAWAKARELKFEGESVKQIAFDLNIDIKTVDGYLGITPAKVAAAYTAKPTPPFSVNVTA